METGGWMIMNQHTEAARNAAGKCSYIYNPIADSGFKIILK